MAITLKLDTPEMLAELTSGRMSREEYRRFCELNPDLRVERSAQGVVSVSPPTHHRTGERNGDISADLVLWNRQSRLGKAYDSSTGFDLPDGSNRSPDASWIRLERLNRLTADERCGFLQTCPDFVVELRSISDSLPRLREKMKEWIANGARLAWLIDPMERRVHIYRPGQAEEILENPASVNGDPELPGFTLELERIWAAD